MRLMHIGTDEAGYGPTLGPLVITATVWEGPHHLYPNHWYDLLSPFVVSAPRLRPSGTGNRDDEQAPVVITDSKRIYRSGGGLGGLERTALGLLGLAHGIPKSWQELIEYVDPAALADLSITPWLADFNPPLPVAATPNQVKQAANQLLQAMDKADLRCTKIRCRFITAFRFNQELERFASKSELLSHVTLRIVCELLPNQGEVILWADRHGGRAHYANVLYQAFDASFVHIEQESTDRSSYRVSRAQHQFRAVFLTKAERLLPVAAASLVSKYLRELAMLAFNRFWQRHLPGLRPTAGYPVDAQRFLAEIASIQQRLGLSADLVRRRK